MMHLATGKHIKDGTLYVRKAGEKPLEYIKITIEPILVTAVSTGGSGGEDRLTENVTLNFGKFEVVYTPQDKEGKGGAAIPVAWNIPGNVEGLG